MRDPQPNWCLYQLTLCEFSIVELVPFFPIRNRFRVVLQSIQCAPCILLTHWRLHCFQLMIRRLKCVSISMKKMMRQITSTTIIIRWDLFSSLSLSNSLVHRSHSICIMTIVCWLKIFRIYSQIYTQIADNIKEIVSIWAFCRIGLGF